MRVASSASPSGLAPVTTLGVFLAVAALVVGCSAASDGGSEGLVGSLDRSTGLDTILGDDRVATALRAHPGAVPFTYDAVEAMFGIGRRCNRLDSREVWTIEEMQSRLGGAQVDTDTLLPRFVIGGCNQHPATAGSAQETFSLMVAMVSDPKGPAKDPLPVSPVELMALDEKTGLFNFYVLERTSADATNGTVTRFVRTPDDVVMRWQKEPGKPAVKVKHDDRKCYGCHTKGGPIMNELTEPWTGWVSSHGTYSRPDIEGLTRSLVSESRPLAGEHNRSSLANALEQTTRSAIATWVEGLPSSPGSGFGPRTLAGQEPGGGGPNGGLSSLLRSSFCETEVSYASMFDTIPVSLFVDGSLAGLASLEPPVREASVPTMTLLPTRSATDLRIETFLQKAKILTPDTVAAIRVFDGMNEIFSSKRCALHPLVADRLPATGTANVDAVVRGVIGEAMAASPDDFSAPQHDYLLSLLDPSGDPAHRDAREQAYISYLTTAFASRVDALTTGDGPSDLTTRWMARQLAAEGLFTYPVSPLPRTHAHAALP